MALEKKYSVPLIAALIGLFDAFYLTNEHYNGQLACGAQQYIFGLPVDCGYVTQSHYSVFLGIPISLFGLLYYLSIVIILLYKDTIETKITKDKIKFDLLFLLITILGALFSTYLVILQFFILERICLYCMLSALCCLTLICSSVYIYIKN